MSEAIIVFFVCLVGYRAVCAYMDWHPMPLIQVTMNSYHQPRETGDG